MKSKNAISNDKKNYLFLCLLTLSNLITYQLGSISPKVDLAQPEYLREDYEFIKIKARSYLPFENLKPIHIKDHKTIIAHCLLMDLFVETSEYTLYCPKKFINQIISAKNPILLPYQENQKVTLNRMVKRKAYEILIP